MRRRHDPPNAMVNCRPAMDHHRTRLSFGVTRCSPFAVPPERRIRMAKHECRACCGQDGQLVLDLGEQPPCDYFPKYDDPGPDPVSPLQMWLCPPCGLAQLLADPTVPAEPKGKEPAALVAQAED